MASQLGALRDAPSMPARRRRRAAEELASYENRLGGIESRLAVLTWMVGFNLIMTAGIL
jgi:hypothetical protein